MRDHALGKEGSSVQLEASATRLILMVPAMGRRKLHCKFVGFLVLEIVEIFYGGED